MDAKRLRAKTLAPLAAGVALLIAFCSSDSLDPRELAEALSEEMTDEMEFDNGQLDEGEPAEGHEGDAEYPQVSELALTSGTKAADTPIAGTLNATMRLAYTGTNRILIKTGFSLPGEIAGAVVHVLQANRDSVSRRHFAIRFPASLLGGVNGVFPLTLRVKDPARIAGNVFRLRIALLRENTPLGISGLGNFATLTFIAPPLPGVPPRVPHCSCAQGRIVPITCRDSAVLAEIDTRVEMCLLWARAFLGRYFSLANAAALADVEMPAGTRATTWKLPATTAIVDTNPEPCVLELRCP